MAKEPWEEEVFTDSENEHQRRGDTVKTPVLTVLVSLFFVIFVSILIFMFYTSNGNTNREEATTGFYGAKTESNSAQQSSETTTVSEVSSTVSAESTTESTTSESTSVARNGGTIVVEAGEGAGSIAARAGISLDQLYALNPEKMTGPGGTWYANPGDVVYIN